MATVTVFTDSGKTVVTTALVSGVTPYIHWGTGTNGGATVDDSALETPGNEDRVLGTESLVNGGVADDTYQVVGTLTCDSTAKAITEAGIFTTAGSGGPPKTGGVLFLYSTFSAINVAENDQIEFTFKMRFT